MKNEVRNNNGELFLIIGGFSFIAFGMWCYNENIILGFGLAIGMIITSIYFIMMDKTSVMAQPYTPYDLINAKISWNNKIYHIKKFICMGDDIGIYGKYECICMNSGTLEFIYEDELLQLLATDQASLI